MRCAYTGNLGRDNFHELHAMFKSILCGFRPHAKGFPYRLRPSNCYSSSAGSVVSTCTSLSDSGEGEVHNGGHHTVRLDVVVLVVEPEVDELLLCPLDQDIPSVHVSVLKLEGLQVKEEEEEGRKSDSIYMVRGFIERLTSSAMASERVTCRRMLRASSNEWYCTGSGGHFIQLVLS